MDTTDPELLVKLAEKIATGIASDEELEFFLKEFNKLVSNVEEDVEAESLQTNLSASF